MNTGNHDLRVSTRQPARAHASNTREPQRTARIMPRERFARGLFQFNAQLLAPCLAPRFLSSPIARSVGVEPDASPACVCVCLCVWPGCVFRIMQPSEMGSLFLVGVTRTRDSLSRYHFCRPATESRFVGIGSSCTIQFEN